MTSGVTSSVWNLYLSTYYPSTPLPHARSSHEHCKQSACIFPSAVVSERIQTDIQERKACLSAFKSVWECVDAGSSIEGRERAL